MKHARKMILVPSETFKPDPFPHPLALAVSELDNQMDQILKRKDLDDASKWQFYQQALMKHQNLYKVATAPKEIEIASAIPPLNREWINDLPLAYYHKAQSMVDQLESVPERIRWDETGELIVDGRPIKGSNIGEIVQAYLKPKSSHKPVGYFAFISNLITLNSSPPIPGFYNLRPALPSRKPGKPRGRPRKITSPTANKRQGSSPSALDASALPPSKFTRSQVARGKGVLTDVAAWEKLY